MSNEPLVSDQEIYEYACSYLNTTTPARAAELTGQVVRMIYETALADLRDETADMIAKAYGLNEQLRAELRTLRGHLAQVGLRVAQLEAEAAQHRGDHK